MPKTPSLALIVLLLPCSWSGALLAQEDSSTKAVIAVLADNLNEEDLSVLTSHLAFYRQHPINLNTATAEQFKELGFLSAQQISNILLHRLKNGSFQHVLELQVITGFEPETVTLLLPYISVQETSLLKNLRWAKLSKGAEQQLVLRYGQTIEQQKGFKELPGSHYLGGPAKTLLRYQYQLEHKLSLSLLAEKDAGEGFFSAGNKQGFDFYSASMGVYQLGRFNKIIIGDYGLQFGQGLSLWTGTAFGRGADVAGVAKNGIGLKAYTSANEAAFFRGLGTELNISKQVILTTFVSSRALDASLTTLANGTATLSTINVSGLHRSATEINHKQNLQQQVYGLLLNYQTDNLNLGAAAYYSSYEHNFITGKQAYRQYYFTGTALSNLSISYSYTFKNLYFFGETAGSFPGGFASLNGAMASLSASLSALLLYRDFARDHHSFYTQVLAAGADAANEKGAYAGLHFSPSKRWDFSLYGDLFFFPWLRYRIDLPSHGSALSFSGVFNPSKRLRLSVKIGTNNSAQNDTSGLVVNPVSAVQKQACRAGLQWKIKKSFTLENRLEFCRYKKGSKKAESGYLLYQDLSYQPLSSRLGSSLRIAWFNTSSYNTRIYAYEDDVQNGSGSALYNGKGIRTYLNCSYRFSKQLKAWCKYSISYYPQATEIGSGLDQIEGNKKQDIKIQLRYYF